jgi:hypothetical protein
MDPKSCFSADWCKKVGKAQGYNTNGAGDYHFKLEKAGIKGCFLIKGSNKKLDVLSPYKNNVYYGLVDGSEVTSSTQVKPITSNTQSYARVAGWGKECMACSNPNFPFVATSGHMKGKICFT